MSRSRFVLAPLLPCLAALACAQASPPPGGVQDRLPPRIIATTPDTLAIVPGFEGPVVFRFDERISERGITDRSALVSPRTGEVKVERGSDEIRVELEGGWRPGLVYRVILVAGIQDLFGNSVKKPLELAFSTGPAISPALIAGVVTDRITGRPVPKALVQARLRSDSTVYVSPVDSSSFYALRFLQPGFYDVQAFADMNSNGKRDASEPASPSAAIPVNRLSDTLIVELSVVPFDTTPPRVTRGEARDSGQIRLFVDDWLEPGPRLAQVQVSVLHLPDSVDVPGPFALMPVDSFNALEKARAATVAKDTTAAADTAVADTMALREPARLARGRIAAGGISAPRSPVTSPFGAPTEPLPYQELVLVPATPLEPAETYRITLQGLLNISGRPNGGGAVEVTIPEPKPPPRDTSDARLRPVRRSR